MDEDVSGWRGHVIVCGLHDVSLRTVEQLHAAGVPVVVIDDQPEPRLVAVVQGWGIPYIPRTTAFGDRFTAAGLAGASAVICAESTDLATLETALQVRNLRPDVRAVVHLDNPAVGGAIEGITGAGSVLDVAGLFAPSVVDACLGRSAHDLRLEGELFIAAELPVETAGTLRALYGDLAPIGVVQGPDEVVHSCPGRDLQVAPGDQVTLLGTPEDFERARIDGVELGKDEPAHQRRPLHRAALALRSAGDYFDDAVRWTLVACGVIFVISTLILRGFYDDDGDRMSWIESFYFTVETAATVGFGDFSFAAQDPWLQIFAIWLIIAGTIVVSLLFAFVTNALVSRRIEASLGRAPVRGTEDHVILIGLGSVGMRVLEGLRDRGCEVVVVERDEDNRYASQARLLGVRVIVGDATLARTLEAANLDTARAVAVLTSDDMTNIETGLAVREGLAKRWHEVPVILRVFDRSLGHRLEETFEFRHVWSTAAIAAPWFVGAAIGMGVLATFYVGRQPFLVARLTVHAGGGLDGAEMRDLSANVRVIAISRGSGDEGLEYPPRRDTRLVAGDRAYLAGPYEELMQIVRADQ
ncbi:MAG: NAD-binding protein, partial [Solirubrobacteraceae bacterium]|nr:NAD-binding protein [Solirubrobacteraceae bacterium]